MNQKLLKGGHLPDRKCQEILELFCDDLTATQIADVSGVSRVTVNNYFRLIRSVIAAFCESRFPPEHHSGLFMNIDDTVETRTATHDTASGYYGFHLHKGKVATSWIRGICNESMEQLLKVKNNVATGNGNSKLIFEGYHAIADFNDWRLYWLSDINSSSSLTGVLPEITAFWKHAKSRLQKFRGMNKNTLYLHIKECEFRYNFRNEEIMTVLKEIISENGCYGSNRFDNRPAAAGLSNTLEL